uniref:Tc1-like transposase DDE domain-containing protein n=1 Tax=Rhodnius prolixus TaxID=13249 RepID=T1HE22_RHOPR
MSQKKFICVSVKYSEAVDGHCRLESRMTPTLCHLVQNWLSDIVDMFRSKEYWPPNSPDLNPLDFYVWSVVERATNKSRHPNVASLRAAIEAAFADRTVTH